MPFLQNVWYVGGFTHELDDGPISRKICDREIVFYRTEEGNIAALDDRCPHRFVPLSGGKVEGENIRCPYHGLLFGPDGDCVERPHDDGPMQPGLCVKSYTAVDKYNCIWLWIGAEADADPDLIPDFSYQSDTENYDVIFRHQMMACNHQMVTDNILDLSHVHYLHPQIRPEDGFENYENRVKIDGDTVWSILRKPGYIPGAFQRSLWGSDSPNADGRSDTRWDAPSNMLAMTAVAEVGQDLDEGCLLPNSHLVTPETDTTCHYFWAVGRNVRRGEEELSNMIADTVSEVFTSQDGPVLEAQQRQIGNDVDFLAHKPVILKADAAGIRARLTFKKMLKAELSAEQGPGLDNKAVAAE